MKLTTAKGKSGRPTTKTVTKPYLLQAVNYVGSVGKLADAINIDQEQISKWLYTERQIPAHWVKSIVKATNKNVQAWQLRPDVFEADDA